MVYLHSWQEFQDAAEELYTKSPDKVSSIPKDYSPILISGMKARYCVKWRSSEGKLVLKVTDNTSVSYAVLEYCARSCDMSFQEHQV